MKQFESRFSSSPNKHFYENQNCLTEFMKRFLQGKPKNNNLLLEKVSIEYIMSVVSTLINKDNLTQELACEVVILVCQLLNVQKTGTHNGEPSN